MTLYKKSKTLILQCPLESWKPSFLYFPHLSRLRYNSSYSLRIFTKFIGDISKDLDIEIGEKSVIKYRGNSGGQLLEVLNVNGFPTVS